ncbi:MAG: hypothetical protein GTO14_19560 [Anaerolineales bacterium]|nr:hypothetical protein [Anaerolineales bacterium]
MLNSLFKKLGVGALLVLFWIASLAFGDSTLGYAHDVKGRYCYAHPNVRFVKAYTNDDGAVHNSNHDPHDSGNDPGLGKDTARCIAQLQSSGEILVTITNAYPGYTCQFWTKIRNVGKVPLKYSRPVIDSPSELTVTKAGSDKMCGVLYPWKRKLDSYIIRVEQSAKQGSSYSFVIEQKFTTYDKYSYEKYCCR